MRTNYSYESARAMIDIMVQTSQRPGEGNERFVNEVGGFLQSTGYHTRQIGGDPKYSDRSLLVVDFGDPDGKQILSATSHSDVVGIEGQSWQVNPWTLTADGDTWMGRGVCDTHGSGVAMLLAANDPALQKELEDNGQRISVVFTYDEEATSAELSMRGAKFAIGAFGNEPVITSRYFIAGEPTERNGAIVPMASHKGRFLAHFTATVDHSGHVSDDVQNALTAGARVVTEIGNYGRILRYGSSTDEESVMFNPPHSTAQVSAARVKATDYSTTPGTAGFTVDMRTLPDVHVLRTRELTDLILNAIDEPGVRVTLDVEKDAPGSVTPVSSPIARIAHAVTGQACQGFNGGDEGRIFRLQANMEGVTMGPGELRFAHMPNETINYSSIEMAIRLYRTLFGRIMRLEG